ncbi:hypothetical protein K438DRAFT_1848570, partial [Mycena galopus ATCC 62051]
RGTSTAFRFGMGLIGGPLTCLFLICMSMVFTEISFLRKKRISVKTNWRRMESTGRAFATIISSTHRPRTILPQKAQALG